MLPDHLLLEIIHQFVPFEDRPKFNLLNKFYYNHVCSPFVVDMSKTEWKHRTVTLDSLSKLCDQSKKCLCSDNDKQNIEIHLLPLYFHQFTTKYVRQKLQESNIMSIIKHCTSIKRLHVKGPAYNCVIMERIWLAGVLQHCVNLEYIFIAPESMVRYDSNSFFNSLLNPSSWRGNPLLKDFIPRGKLLYLSSNHGYVEWLEENQLCRSVPTTQFMYEIMNGPVPLEFLQSKESKCS
jgi:hypothetical protein